eukprot:TRINITY_DN739_c0_g2_i3.p1 TRINITY_DN739_c0_g2~~TRINITY_DN739_c0_g2_i3.p1  ORF type:complete len:730 (+),score=149.77 TRINITY_DN739_c0_g2_i3:2051-4240(+)
MIMLRLASCARVCAPRSTTRSRCFVDSLLGTSRFHSSQVKNFSNAVRPPVKLQKQTLDKTFSTHRTFGSIQSFVRNSSEGNQQQQQTQADAIIPNFPLETKYVRLALALTAALLPTYFVVNSSSEAKEERPVEELEESLNTLISAAAIETSHEKDTVKSTLWWDLLLPELPLFLAAVVTAFLSSSVSLYIPRVIGRMIDLIKKEGATSLGKDQILLCVGLLLGQVVVHFTFSVLLSIATERFSINLREALFEALLRRDIGFFDQTSTGELISSVSADVQEIRGALKHSVSVGVKGATQIVGGVISLFLISKKLTTMMVILIPTVVLAGTIYARLLQKLSRSVQDAMAKATGSAEETVSNIRTVRAFANEQYMEERYSQKLERHYYLAKLREVGIALFGALYQVTIQGYVLLVLLYGGKLVSSGLMSDGDLTSYMLYTMNLQFSLGTLSILQGELVKGLGATGRINQLIGSMPAIPLHGGHILPQVKGSIEFRHVSFHYPSRPDSPVLKDLDVRLEEAKVYAIVGPSGSGKSTLAWLIERFYEPQSGQVLIDGVDIKTLDPSWLRRQIALVSQEPVLFATTIAENIRFGKPDATPEEVAAAAQLANANEFIRDFPLGYETVVGERGIQLSGGQKQRIAIARAILKNAKILILDEATSALDAQSEHSVQEALQRLMRGRTTLLIAHRLSTVRNADAILVMKNGRILESGSHEVLMAKQNGEYAKLVQKQMK